MVLPEIIALALCIFPLVALGATLLGSNAIGGVLIACNGGTVALIGIPLAVLGTVGNLINNAILPFLFAS